jgi:uncharacterized protein with HEPN domain
MSSLQLADYLGHMLKAAREARGFVEGQRRESFLADRRTQQAVVMSLLIVGEAAVRIMENDPAFVREHRAVPWRNIRGMRNRMAHGYFETNYEIVWETVSVEIPRLITVLSDLLAKPAPEQKSEAQRD